MTLIKPSLIQLLVGVSLTGITAGLLYLLLGKDEDDVEELVQRIKTSRSATIEVKIPKDSVGVVIGRGGANIKDIQDKSETKINFKDEQVEEGFRVCIIRGTPEAAQLAESLIHEFISNQPLIEVSTIMVPQNACGRIIGRNGENIRSISRASSAKITVESVSTNDKSAPTAVLRRVFIKGTGDQIEIAKALIQEKVEEDAEIRKKMETLNSRPPRGGKETVHYLTAGPDAQIQSETDASEKLAAVSSDGSMEVYVSAVSSPSTFWVQMYGPRAVDLDFLVEQMTDYYNKEENQELHAISKIQINQMVAALFDYDKKWYRARVVKVTTDEYDPADSEIEVYFVDYGDWEKIKLRHLLRLRTDFLQLRFQAIECSLANVKPKEGKWTSEAIDAFESLVYVARWVKLTARVHSYQKARGLGTVSSDLQAPCIELFDTSGSQDISIAEELVKQGFAEWTKESPERRSKNRSRSSSARASPSPSPIGSRLSVASEKGTAGDSPSRSASAAESAADKENKDTSASATQSTGEKANKDASVTDETLSSGMAAEMNVGKTADNAVQEDITKGRLKDEAQTIPISNDSQSKIPLNVEAVRQEPVPVQMLSHSTSLSKHSGLLPAEALSDFEDDDDDGFDAP